MTGQELRALRLGAGIKLTSVAQALRLTTARLAGLEYLGHRDIPADLAHQYLQYVFTEAQKHWTAAQGCRLLLEKVGGGRQR